MNLDELTLKDIKLLSGLFNNNTTNNKNEHAFLGKYVLCRTINAGVHTGVLAEIDDDKVILNDSRRLWSWKGTGVALSGVANGKLIDGKIDTVNPEIYLTGVIEIIPCTKESEESIRCK